jgi:hypothetical protein
MKGGACVSEEYSSEGDWEERPARPREASATGGKPLRSAVPGLALFCVNIILVVYLTIHFVGLASAGHAGRRSPPASPPPAPAVATATDTVAPLAATPVTPEQSPAPTDHAAATATPAAAASPPPSPPTATPTTAPPPQPTATPTFSPIG